MQLELDAQHVQTLTIIVKSALGTSVPHVVQILPSVRMSLVASVATRLIPTVLHVLT